MEATAWQKAARERECRAELPEGTDGNNLHFLWILVI